MLRRVVTRHFPARDEFREAATRGNLIPVYREILADGDTPVSAYAKLGRRDYSFLLESVVGGQKWAAYSFLGVEPRAILRARSGNVEGVWRDVDGGGPDKTALRWGEITGCALSKREPLSAGARSDATGAHRPPS